MIYGYVREGVGKKSVSVPDQTRAIMGYCGRRGWEFDATRSLFVDYPEPRATKRVAFREAATEMLDRVGSGDLIVVHSFGHLFLSAYDFAWWPKRLFDRGVELHLADRSCSLSEVSVVEYLAIVEGANRLARYETMAIRAAVRFGVKPKSQ